MSFTSHMIASLKHNKRERVSAFEKLKNFKEGNNIQVNFNKKSSSYQLKKIREKLTTENRIRNRRNLLILVIAMSVIIYVVRFVKL